MRTLKLLSILFCFSVVISSVCSWTARGDAWDKKTIVTFSGPVEVSGTKLEAGTYVFKLLDSPSDRHIVQIFNQDQTHLITTILALPNYRLTPTDKTAIKFVKNWEDMGSSSGTLSEAGVPIKEWFYPGDNFGQEFLVKSRPVIPQTTPPPPLMQRSEAVETPAAEPEPKPVETAQVQPPAEPEAPAAVTETEQPAQTQPTEKKAPAELPQTASPMPLVALVGLVSLGLGFSLRLISNRLA